MRLSLGLSYGFCLQTWLVRLSMAELVCQKKSECSCYLQGHGMIDLHSTATSFNKTVANVSFHWQPCKVFTDSQSQGVCKDVNLCKYDKQNQTYTNLGSQSQFLYTAGHVIMRYSGWYNLKIENSKVCLCFNSNRLSCYSNSSICC